MARELIIPEARELTIPEERVLSIPGLKPTEPTTLGGVVTSIGAGVAAGFTAPGRFVGAGLEVIEDITGIDLPGQSLSDVSNFAQRFWQKRIGKSKAERLLGSSAETIGTIASTAAVTGGKSLLVALAGGAGLEKTAEARREGQPVLNAYGAGIVTAATEYLTEKIPIGKLQKPGLSFIKRLVGGAIFDVPGELAAAAIEMSIVDKGILGKDHHLTSDQYIDILKETAAVSILSTIGLSGGSQVLDTVALDALNRVKAIPPSEPHISVEKQEVTPVSAQAREDAKSGYPELSKQANSVIQDDSLDLKPSTKDIPDTTDVPQVEKPKSTWQETMDESRSVSLEKQKTTTGKVWRGFIKGFVDVSGNLQAKMSALGNLGKKVVMRQNAMGGASTKGSNEADAAKKPIFDGLNTEQKQLFDDYISALRHLEIRRNKGASFTLPGNHTEQSIEDFTQSIAPDVKEALDVKAKIWSQKMGEVLNLMRTEGLLTDQQVVDLRAEGEFYVPRQVLDFIDPEVQQKNREGKTITARDSGLKNLSEDGSDKLIETDSELLLEQVYQRAWTRVFKNRANLELQNLAQNEPGAKGLVRENPVVGVTGILYEITDAQGKKTRVEVKNEAALKKIIGKKPVNIRKIHGPIPIFKDVKANEMRVSVLNNGIRNELVMPLELGSEWVTGDPILSATWSSIIGWASGNKILKAMATTLNPEFAITNVPRDLSHIWLTTEEYSSLAPVAGLQMARDMSAVVKDALTKKGLYQTYIDNGGGMEFLAHQGKLGLKGTTALTKGISSLETVMSKAGEFSETITRLSLMRRAMRNGKSPFEATQIARGYLDFARGGSVAKAMNSAIPFFNAGIQATRGVFRAAKTNPKVFAAKVFQITSMAFGLAMANMMLWGEDYEDVSDHDKDNSWPILTNLTFIDSNGTERRRYIRLPKDQGQRAFAKIGEAWARKALGRPVDSLSIVEEVNNILPILPGELLPPAVEMMLGYSANKNFWTNEDIWRGEDVLPQEEYYKYTPTPYVKIGAATGKSPARLQYATQQLFTRGNIWTSLVGYASKQIFDEMTPEERQKTSNELLEKYPGVRRITRSTRPDLRRKKEIKEEKTRLDTERLIRNRQMDAIAERFFRGQTDQREVEEFISRQETLPDRKSMARRFRNLSKLQGVTNRSFWFDLLDLPPEQRAVNYWNQWVQLDQTGRKELDRQSFRVPTFRSKRFNIKFFKMKKFGERAGR